jgi:hypothetical protein
MRDGLDAPTLQLPVDNVAEVGAFLDGQSRIELAVWVRHEQSGPEGRSYDHHLVLAVSDDDWATGDIRALEDGLQLPALATSRPTWIDLFPISEVEELRAFGTVLWEQERAGADPLDYRQSWEPYAAEPAVAERFREHVSAAAPWVERVEATVRRLWNGDLPEWGELQLYVHAPAGAGPTLEVVGQALRSSGLEADRSGCTLGLPRDPRIRTATLYEAAR